jgi:hypothetical protein
MRILARFDNFRILWLQMLRREAACGSGRLWVTSGDALTDQPISAHPSEADIVQDSAA